MSIFVDTRLQRQLLLVALLTVLALGAAVTPNKASAGELVLRPCDTPAQDVGWELPQFPVFGVELECPLIRAWSGAIYGAPGQVVVARYPAIFVRDNSVYIKRAKMQIAGLGLPELGRHQGVRFCSKTACGPILPRRTAREGEWEFSFVPNDSDSEIPTSAQWMEVVGMCDAGVQCPAASELRVSDISLTYEDFVVPTLSWREPFITETTLGSSKWIAAPAAIAFSADDKGSGIAHTRFEFSPSGHVQIGYAPCTLLDQAFENRFCLSSASGREGTPDPRARPDLLPEGSNTVRFWAVDMGRRTSAVREIKFNVDITPPQAPRNMRVVGAPSGWTNQTVADVEWDPIDDGAGQLKLAMVKIGSNEVSPLGGNPGVVRDVTLAPGSTTAVQVHGVDKAGNVGPSSTLIVGHDDYVLAPPVLDTPHYIGRDALQSGRAVNWQPPIDLANARSGICGYSLSVDNDPEGLPPSAPNLPGLARSAPAPGDRFEGDHFMHIRAVSCSTQAGRAAHVPVTYDLTPPRADFDRPRGNWLNEGEPLVLRGDDAQTAVKAMHYTIDDGTEVSVPGDQVKLVLPDGLHDVHYQAEDLAGNRSDPSSILIGVDGSPPIAWIEPSEAERPTLVRAFAADGRAGLDSAQFVYRPAGSNREWIPFGTEQRPSPAAPEALTLSARIPDLTLTDGDYELGVIVKDRVGREAVSTTSTLGTEARVNLPLRVVPRFRFRLIDDERSVPSAYVAFGSRSHVLGRLTDSVGNPLANAQVELTERRAFTVSSEPIGSLTTDPNGRFTTRLRPGVAREVVATFAGSERLKPVNRAVKLHTRSRVKLAVSPRRVRAGGTLRFDMRIALAGSSISNVGKLADLQFQTASGKWENYTIDGPYNLQLDPRRRGWARFVKRDAAPEFRSPRILRFRLFVPLQERWPYAQGWSRTVSVLVLPRERH